MSRGNFDQARELFGQARAMLEEVSLPVWKAGGLTQVVGWALLLENKPEAAERELRQGQPDAADARDRRGHVPLTVAGILAEALYVLARYDEAERLTHIGEESAGAEEGRRRTPSGAACGRSVWRNGATWARRCGFRVKPSALSSRQTHCTCMGTR